MPLIGESWEGCLSKEGVATLGCIWVVLQNIINVAFILSGVVALFYIITAGIKFITSRGDTEAIDSARKTLTFAIIGLIFILLSYFLLNFILDSVGVKITKPGG